MPLRLLEQTVLYNRLIPVDDLRPSPRQIRFLELECLDALYGGAAGGGKSDALLMGAVQFHEVPGYAALILRRTLQDLKMPGALLDRAHEWFRGKGDYNATEHRWRFPFGSTLQFGYCETEKDVYRYDGAEFQFIGLDEATQFSEFQIKFLFGRLRRRVSIPVPLRFRLASNPGNVGHDFVKRRYIAPGESGKLFIPAKLKDNPGLDQAGYIRSLNELDPVTRVQRLEGDWNSYQGGRFKREWFRRWERWGGGYRVPAPGGTWRHVEHLRFLFQTCDPAASEKTTADYTVVCTWGVTDRWELFWLDMLRFQKSPPDILPILLQNWREWQRKAQADKTTLSFLGIERVAANNAILEFSLRLPMVVKPLDTHGLDKLVRATPAMNLAASGRLYLPFAAPWLDDAEGELVRFTGDPKQDANDDIVDNVSYAAEIVGQPPEDGSRGVPTVIGGI